MFVKCGRSGSSQTGYTQFDKYVSKTHHLLYEFFGGTKFNLNNDVARRLKKLHTLKGDYCIKQ